MRSIVAVLVSGLFACAFSSQAVARPDVIDEWVRLAPPTDRIWQHLGGFGVAIDGDWALVSAYNWAEAEEGGNVQDCGALLYRYSGGTWSYQGMLGTTEQVDEWHSPGYVAMKDGIAVTKYETLKIYELVNGVWTQAATSLPSPPTSAGGDIEINGGRILLPTGHGLNAHTILRKMNGVWGVEGHITGNTYYNGSEYAESPEADLENGRVVVLNKYDDTNAEVPAALRRYRVNENNVGWREQQPLEDLGWAHAGPYVAMSGQYTAFSYRRTFGTRLVYDHENGGQFARYGIQPADGSMQGEFSDTGVERVRGMFATRNWSPDRRAQVWNLFEIYEDGAHTSNHAFTLQAANGQSLGGWLDASGNRVIVSGHFDTHHSDEYLDSNTVRIYQLPTFYSGQPVQPFGFDYPGTPPDWELAPGSVFTVTRVNNNDVWRQADTTNTATAILTANSFTRQSIQTEVTLRAFTGTNSWVGLFTRRGNDANYYYVTLRTNGRVELKRMLNGVFTTLTSAPANLGVGVKVRLRLESMGVTHRVFINDRLVLTARDPSLKGGTLGLMTNRAAADFDNVIAGPAPFTTIYADDFAAPAMEAWTPSEGTWQRAGGVLTGSSATGYARLIVGARTDDQIVQVRVRPISFVEPANWVGLLLRYEDTRNHAYVSLQGRGTISLWKRTNGAIQQLATRSVAVTPGTWYTLRAETVSGETRVYVNDVLQLTALGELGPVNPDVTIPKGSVGLITQKATAEFDDFLAYQP